MYEFHIEKKGEETWKFELEGVNMLIDGYAVKNDKHLILHPAHTIAYFYMDGNIYSIRNKAFCRTAEDFFDLIQLQIYLLKKTG